MIDYEILTLLREFNFDLEKLFVEIQTLREERDTLQQALLDEQIKSATLEDALTAHGL